MNELYPTMINKEKAQMFKNITGQNVTPSYLSKIKKNWL
jgi:hypothetical protein